MPAMKDAFAQTMSRRSFGMAAATAALGSFSLFDACAPGMKPEPGPAVSGARITARPKGNGTTTLVNGALGLGTDRDGVVQMPSATSAGPLPLLVFLHGATQSGAAMLRRIGAAADEAGFVVLAPDSRDRTWDAITGPFGDDVMFISHAIDYVLAHAAIDPARIVIGGFSDGASYALSLGLANGDLASRIVACSPGFVVPAAVNGHPRVFISHGTSDPVLPIDECSRVIVPRLRSMGYDVTFREFDGRHEIPPEVGREAMQWAAGGAGGPRGI
jgi:phospholipase/carboxylesterase